MENEYSPTLDYEFSSEYVVIDPFTCDLNLAVDRECLLAYPLSGEGFSSMWGGCRATYGTYNAKTVFEVHLEDHCDNTFIPKDDADPYLLRVGWSLNDTSLQLGEDVFSFAYCSNGKKCCNKVFEDYGEVYQKGDSIAAYINFDDKNEIILISFSKNGLDLGTAFKIHKRDVSKFVQDRKNKYNLNQQISNEKPEYIFFPHVLSKNYVFEINFGQRVSLIGDEPFAPIRTDFKLIQKLPFENRFFNDSRLLEKKECEAIFLIGLPASGKTYWANEHMNKHPEKKFSIVGFSHVLEKLRMLGLKKKASSANISSTSEASIYTSSSKIQQDLLEKCLKCMNILIEIAVQSNRNVIIDQANVYKSARRRKLKYFEGFGPKRAVVIVPNDQEYKERIKKSEQEDGKEIPNSLLNDMKGNFSLPDDSEFDSIEYVELQKEEASLLIEKYNEEGINDRFNAYVNKRNKISEEKKMNLAKMGALNTSFIRPLIRPGMTIPYPQMMPQSMYQQPLPSMIGNRFTRYPNMLSAQQNIRRGYNQIYPNQMPRPGVDFLAGSSYPAAAHMGAYLSIPPPSMNLVQPPASYYIQTQTPASNWAPAMPLSNLHHHQQASFIIANQASAPAYMTPGTQSYHQPLPTSSSSNDWNPALSTNVTNLISSSTSSVYTTQTNNQNQNK